DHVARWARLAGGVGIPGRRRRPGRGARDGRAVSEPPRGHRRGGPGATERRVVGSPTLGLWTMWLPRQPEASIGPATRPPLQGITGRRAARVPAATGTYNDCMEPRPGKLPRRRRAPSGRLTNLQLLLALALTFATGVGAVATGSARGRWIVIAHGMAAMVVVLLIPWKSRIAKAGLRLHPYG